jgi:hypothetical protein
VLHVALEVPLPALPLGGGAEGDHAAVPRVQALGDALDDPALAGSIAAFEDHDDAVPLEAHRLLELEELELQPRELLDVFVPLGLRLGRLPLADHVPVPFDARVLARLLEKVVIGIHAVLRQGPPEGPAPR